MLYAFPARRPPMLKPDIESILTRCRAAGQGDDFAALALIVYLEDQGLSLEGNGWLDDDPETAEEINRNAKAYRPIPPAELEGAGPVECKTINQAEAPTIQEKTATITEAMENLRAIARTVQSLRDRADSDDLTLAEVITGLTTKEAEEREAANQAQAIQERAEERRPTLEEAVVDALRRAPAENEPEAWALALHLEKMFGVGFCDEDGYFSERHAIEFKEELYRLVNLCRKVGMDINFTARALILYIESAIDLDEMEEGFTEDPELKRAIQTEWNVYEAFVKAAQQIEADRRAADQAPAIQGQTGQGERITKPAGWLRVGPFLMGLALTLWIGGLIISAAYVWDLGPCIEAKLQADQAQNVKEMMQLKAELEGLKAGKPSR